MNKTILNIENLIKTNGSIIVFGFKTFEEFDFIQDLFVCNEAGARVTSKNRANYKPQDVGLRLYYSFGHKIYAYFSEMSHYKVDPDYKDLLKIPYSDIVSSIKIPRIKILEDYE